MTNGGWEKKNMKIAIKKIAAWERSFEFLENRSIVCEKSAIISNFSFVITRGHSEVEVSHREWQGQRLLQFLGCFKNPGEIDPVHPNIFFAG